MNGMNVLVVVPRQRRTGVGSMEAALVDPGDNGLQQAADPADEYWPPRRFENPALQCSTATTFYPACR